VTAAYTARTHTLVTKMMFWALAGVTFSAAKIVSCNKNFFFHGLPSTLVQLFYFSRQKSECNCVVSGFFFCKGNIQSFKVEKCLSA
jgi:hypothetical protein